MVDVVHIHIFATQVFSCPGSSLWTYPGSLTQVPAQVAPVEDWPGPSADVDDLQLVEGGEQVDDDDNDDADADDDDLQLVEGGEQVDDSCSSAGEFSPGSRQGAVGKQLLN